MAKSRDKKEIRSRSRSRLRSAGGSVHTEPGQRFKLSEKESRLLGELWDGQKSSARSNFSFTHVSRVA